VIRSAGEEFSSPVFDVMKNNFVLTLLSFFCLNSIIALAADSSSGLKPVGSAGKPLNLDFEAGSLKDWKAEGNAFEKQPVRGDTVYPRRNDMKSAHQGNYWIGTFEVGGDDLLGTLTSVPFKVTQPWGSFLVAGGPWPTTRVEIVDAATQQVIFKASGYESESLRPVVIDLQKQAGKDVFIRIVDQQKGHWGHINFDDFKLHAQRPKFDNELDPAKTIADAPPADVVPFAGLSPQDSCDKATLPPGFKMHVFAAEPDVQQPIAFCLDHRGRVWVAEGFTYPKRRGNPPRSAPILGAAAPSASNATGISKTPLTADALRPGRPRSDSTQPTPDQIKDIFGGADRILVFEDTDGDHKFDKRTVFLENLNLVSGLEYGFGGIWVGAAPYLLFIPVQEGDAPKPDGDPQILLDGWNYTADTHETLNTFTWGPDGWLYGCHGVFCPSHVGKAGAPESERQWMDAGVWRYHPTKHVFEVFTEGGSNPWGIDFDEYGQLFAEMCVIPHFWHMIQGARIERQGGEHFSIDSAETARNERCRDPRSRKPVFPYVYEDIKQHGDHVHWAGGKGPHAANARSDAVGGGHAHAGVMCYLGASWPEEYRGKLFIGNIHGQRLNMDSPVREGSGYVGKHGKDFLNFNDTWSQTLNQLYDQDGSVFIIDWYDKNQCHHNREDGHDRSNGRIYKIVYNDQKTTKVDLQKSSDEELVKLVPSKNEWMSRHARRVLQERVAVSAEKEAPMLQARGSEVETIKRHQAPEKLGGRQVLTNILDKQGDTTSRLRAFWTLHVCGALGSVGHIKYLDDRDEYVRCWAYSLIAEDFQPWQTEGKGAQGPPRLGGSAQHILKRMTTAAASDRSPWVRRYIASALQRIPVEQRWTVLTELLQHAEDASDHNLPLMYWYAAEACVATDPDRALELLKVCKIPKVREFIARRLATMSLTSAK
jgi:putative membrane-bound dehydrogenase-like protein